METTTRRPQFSGPSTISPGNPATGPTSALHADDVESGVVRGGGEPTERFSVQGVSPPAAGVRGLTPSSRASWLEGPRLNVRRRPLTWIGIALAAGAVVARMARRSR